MMNQSLIHNDCRGSIQRTSDVDVVRDGTKQGVVRTVHLARVVSAIFVLNVWTNATWSALFSYRSVAQNILRATTTSAQTNTNIAKCVSIRYQIKTSLSYLSRYALFCWRRSHWFCVIMYQSSPFKRNILSLEHYVTPVHGSKINLGGWHKPCAQKLAASTWRLEKIIRIPYTRHVNDVTVYLSFQPLSDLPRYLRHSLRRTVPMQKPHHHYLEVIIMPHAKFGLGKLNTVAVHKEQRNRQIQY